MSDYQKQHAIGHLLIDLHTVFGLRYFRDAEDGTWHVDSDHPDWRLNPFLELLAEHGQSAIIERVDRLRKEKAARDASKLIGGPFDGEQIAVHLSGGTEARQIRRGWWAVYKRKPGEYPAHFVGFATSQGKARNYELVHHTPASEYRPAGQQSCKE